MTKKIAVALIFALIVTLGLSFAQDQPSQGEQMNSMMRKGRMMQMHQRMQKMHGRRGGGRRLHNRIITSFFLHPMMIELLDLSEEQLVKLEKMQVSHSKKMIDSRAELAKMRIDLKVLMRDVDMDLSAIESKMQQIANKKVQMKMAALKSFQKAQTVLTAEQKAKLKEFWKKGGVGQTRMQSGDQSMVNPPEDVLGEEAVADEGMPQSALFLGTMIPLVD